MNKKPLGNSGMAVPPLIFGGNVFGWTADEATSFALLDSLMEAGFNAIDTAEAYSYWAPGHRGGESETVIGNWLHRRGGRDHILIFSKVGLLPTTNDPSLSSRNIMRAVEDSLRRLRTDYIDLYQAHRDDETTTLDETLEAFARLIEAGKVRAIGASNYTAARLGQALDTSRRLEVPRYEVLQTHYNLLERAGYEDALEPLCQKEQLGVISFFSLAAGFLTGKYRSEADLAQSARGPRYISKYLNPRSFRILAAVEAAAKEQGVTAAEIAIAWIIARPSVTAPIASATSLDQLRTLLTATRVSLDRDTIAALDAASA
jgi:aryl-alcohol dehydrogenase-like predicted oxidoreductase